MLEFEGACELLVLSYSPPSHCAYSGLYFGSPNWFLWYVNSKPDSEWPVVIPQYSRSSSESVWLLSVEEDTLLDRENVGMLV